MSRPGPCTPAERDMPNDRARISAPHPDPERKRQVTEPLAYQDFARTRCPATSPGAPGRYSVARGVNPWVAVPRSQPAPERRHKAARVPAVARIVSAPNDAAPSKSIRKNCCCAPGSDRPHQPIRMIVWVAVLAIRGYQLTIRPLLIGSCKFCPSCSEYAIIALERHGLLRGGAFAVRRLFRCHPFGRGGIDPVP